MNKASRLERLAFKRCFNSGIAEHANKARIYFLPPLVELEPDSDFFSSVLLESAFTGVASLDSAEAADSASSFSFSLLALMTSGNSLFFGTKRTEMLFTQ